MKKRLMTMAVMAMTVMMMTMPMTAKAEDAPLQPGDTGVADDGTPYTVDQDGFVNFGNVDYSTDNGQQGRDWEARNQEASKAQTAIEGICQKDGLTPHVSENPVKALATYQYVDSLIQSGAVTTTQADKILVAAGSEMTDLGAAQAYYEKNYVGSKAAAPAAPDTTKKDTAAKTDTAATTKANATKQEPAVPAETASETVAADAPSVSTYEDNFLPIEQVSGNDVSANDVSANEATVTAETETGSVSDNALVSSQPTVTAQKSNTARNVGVGAGIVIIAAIGIVVKKKFF